MKEILLKGCHECPYLFDDGGELALCKKKFGKPFDIYSFKDFPDWCPLPDAPQQTNSCDSIKDYNHAIHSDGKGRCVHPRGYIKSVRVCGLCGEQV